MSCTQTFEGGPDKSAVMTITLDKCSSSLSVSTTARVTSTASDASTSDTSDSSSSSGTSPSLSRPGTSFATSTSLRFSSTIANTTAPLTTTKIVLTTTPTALLPASTQVKASTKLLPIVIPCVFVGVAVFSFLIWFLMRRRKGRTYDKRHRDNTSSHGSSQIRYSVVEKADMAQAGNITTVTAGFGQNKRGWTRGGHREYRN